MFLQKVERETDRDGVRRERERAMRKGNWSVTVWDLCTSVCTVVVPVCVCVGRVKVTLNGIAACVNTCVAMQIPLERVLWRLSSASTSIYREEETSCSTCSTQRHTIIFNLESSPFSSTALFSSLGT